MASRPAQHESRSSTARPTPALQLLDQARAMQPPRLAAHHRRVGAMSHLLARCFGLDEDGAEAIGLAGSHHDIGMTLLPSDLLEQEGLLSVNERTLIHKHSAWGCEMLMMADPELALSAQVALQHHERWDGSGYPSGLIGDGICLAARIVAICAAYDSWRHPRSGKEPLGHEAALAVILSGDNHSSAAAFDPQLREIFAEHGNDFRRIVEN